MEEPTYDSSCPAGKTTIVYQYKLANCPGKTTVGFIVEYPPNGATPPHRHGGPSVSAYVLKGSVLCKMNNDPMKVIEQGESYANVSKTEGASFFVNFVVDTEKLEKEGPGVLVQIDEEYQEAFAQKMKGG
ncbi:hypothetical protein BJX64DRAFT_282188 [Aspergillus heterothallicus]